MNRSPFLFLFRETRSALAFACLPFFASLPSARAEDPKADVAGVTGVKQDADKIKPVNPDLPPLTVPPPPPPTVPPPAVEGVKGVKQENTEQIKPVTQAPPPPPPLATVNAVKGSGSIQAVHGVGGLNAAKLQNLEAALQLKASQPPPPSNGAEHDGKGKAAAAALLAAPLDKPAPKIAPIQDGRSGFHEFEKLQNRGS